MVTSLTDFPLSSVAEICWHSQMDTMNFDTIYEKPDPWGVRLKSFSNKRRRQVIRSLAPLFKDKTVLEVGCGEGSLTPQIASYCRKVVGIDISQTAIDRTPKIGNASFFATSMTDFDYSHFDLVTMLECLYYLSEDDQHQVLSKIKTSLIISAPIIGENEHRRYYTRDTLVRLLSDHGFGIDRSFIMSLRWDGSIARKVAINTIKAIDTLGVPILSVTPRQWVYQMLFVCVR
jgi:SAM-dependent methyltransferase